MGGCRCSYRNCPNSTKTTENIHFFHYPVKHKERCKIWIDNARKPQFLNLEEDQLRNKVICEMHFEDKWFPNIQKKRLLQGAVPTLDGECTEVKTSLDFDSYLISDVPNDIQVLPVSEDGSCFILDTDFLVSKSAKVESFVYKNGSILPSNQVTNDSFFESKSNVNTDSRSIANTITLNSNVLQDHGYEEEVIKDSSDINKSIKTEVIDQDIESNTSTDQNTVIKGGIEKRRIGRSYLRKIKEHSREIASIKKMLKEKVIETKSDYKTIMDSLREQLPPTLLSIVNLHLDSKCDLSSEDVEFFTTFYKTSPEAYALLMERYSWNMPCVQQSE